MKFAVIAVFLTVLAVSESANILFWLPFSFKSGMVAYMPLVEELGQRGHKVTVIASNVKDSVKNPNIVQISTGDASTKWTDEAADYVLRGQDPPFAINTFCEANDQALQMPEVRNLIAKDMKYDMIVVYVDFTCSETGHYLSQRFDAPLVLLSLFQNSWSYLDYSMGQPNNPAYMPSSMLPYVAGEMTFMQRWISALSTSMIHALRNYHIMGKIEAILDKHFPGEDRLPILELEKRASLAISFGHPHLTDGWKPTMPNYIQIGMMLCNPKVGKLVKSDKIEQFLDKGPTILVSFGSLMKASIMPKEKIDVFIDAFEKLKPLQIIWKFESSDLDDRLPSNVMILNWLPQQAILAHPNTKLFITHVGQSSFQESICHKTPMVAIPLFGDQDANAVETERLKIGVRMKYMALTVDDLVENVHKVLNDKSYQETVNHLGDVLTDEIDRPLDRAIWWMEHVLRHPKLYVGKAAVHKLTWAQYFLLDVIAFTVLILVVIAVVLHYICMWTCCKKRAKETEVKPKQN